MPPRRTSICFCHRAQISAPETSERSRSQYSYSEIRRTRRRLQDGNRCSNSRKLIREPKIALSCFTASRLRGFFTRRVGLVRVARSTARRPHLLLAIGYWLFAQRCRLCLSGFLCSLFLGAGNGFDAFRFRRAPFPVPYVCASSVSSHSPQDHNRKGCGDKGRLQIVLVLEIEAWSELY